MVRGGCMTKTVNVFDLKPRRIKCIANEHDYLGNGAMIREENLEPGKIYFMERASAEPYGEMVYLKEIPNDWGFQAYLFEELQEYDENILINNRRQWLLDKLAVSRAQVDRGEVMDAHEAFRKIREKLNEENKAP